MKILIAISIILLVGCQNRQDKLLNEYIVDMWIHENLILNEELSIYQDDILATDAADLIQYIESFESKLKGFDTNQRYDYDDFKELDSLLDYKTNTAEFYGTDSEFPIKTEFSFFSLKTKLEEYLNQTENVFLGETLFQQFRDGELQPYRAWSWESKTFYNIPTIQLMAKFKEIKLNIYRIERIKQRRANRVDGPATDR